MKIEDLFRVLKETKLPVAYHHFEEGHRPNPPFSRQTHEENIAFR